MKTKLLAVMMMGLAAFGSISGIALAQGYDFSQADGFWGSKGVGNIKGVSGTTNEGASSSSLLSTITTAINWILGMLALIALCICLYGGFQMVTAAGDDGKYKKGMTILKQAAIGLIIVGIAWLFVSLIFWLIGTLSTDNGDTTDLTAGGTNG